tara:strand:+ start:4554 stop:4736 length:183 start_codon:yes stop_codon:yes gene_type:complete
MREQPEAGDRCRVTAFVPLAMRALHHSRKPPEGREKQNSNNLQNRPNQEIRQESRQLFVI